MSVKNAHGTVLIRENALLPKGLALKSEAFLPGWRIVPDIDAFELARQIDEAHWTFFYLAGEMKAIVFGREQPGALRGAVKRILAKRKTPERNALQITSVVSQTFLGIPFMSVTAVSRHILGNSDCSLCQQGAGQNIGYVVHPGNRVEQPESPASRGYTRNRTPGGSFKCLRVCWR